ncbi:MAG: hypothetical protein FWG98_12085, partial [Candidatus Cloacimonetes bacterium]|nr:hypothetical protein [Candidatus Cloacimonadota bacterium]
IKIYSLSYIPIPTPLRKTKIPPPPPPVNAYNISIYNNSLRNTLKLSEIHNFITKDIFAERNYFSFSKGVFFFIINYYTN